MHIYHGCQLFIFAAAFFAMPIAADQYEQSRDTHFYLGGGVNPLKVNEGLATCIKHAGTYNLDGPGVRNASIVLKAVRNRKELYSTLGASVAISAQSFFGGGKLSADYLEQSEFFDDSLTWVVLAKSDFGRVGLKNPELLPKFQRLIEEGKHDEFAATCGSHYFSQEARSASVFAIYTLRNLSQSQKTRFETILKAGVSFGPIFSGSIESEFKSMLSQAMRSSQLSCHVYAVGGHGAKELSGLIQAYTEDVAKVGHIIANYVSKLGPENAATTSFQTASMREFGHRESMQFDFEKRDDVLAQHYLLMREGQDMSARLFSLIFKNGSAAGKLSENQLAEYKRTYEILTHDLEALHASASRCYRDANACTYPTTTLPYVSWPASEQLIEQCVDLSLLPSRFKGWQRPNDVPAYGVFTNKQCKRIRDVQFRSGCINAREAAELELMAAVPMCIDHSTFIGLRFC